VQVLAQLTPPEPGAPDLLSMFRAERDDHGDAVAHLVEDRRAEIAHGGNHRLDDTLAGGLRPLGHRIDAANRHHGDGARLWRVAPRDVEGLPGGACLVLGEAPWRRRTRPAGPGSRAGWECWDSPSGSARRARCRSPE